MIASTVSIELIPKLKRSPVRGKTALPELPPNPSTVPRTPTDKPGREYRQWHISAQGSAPYETTGGNRKRCEQLRCGRGRAAANYDLTKNRQCCKPKFGLTRRARTTHVPLVLFPLYNVIAF